MPPRALFRLLKTIISPHAPYFALFVFYSLHRLILAPMSPFVAFVFFLGRPFCFLLRRILTISLLISHRLNHDSLGSQYACHSFLKSKW